MKILGASLGNCVHVAGVVSFLELARRCGHETVFLGPAVPVERVVEGILAHRPDVTAISYRLTPATAGTLFDQLRAAYAAGCADAPTRFVFGGTPPVAKVARASGIFERVFDGREPPDGVLAFLKDVEARRPSGPHPQTIPERVRQKSPYPLIRHHFGLPSLEATVEGARTIAESGVVDILSIAPDQNAQSFFFRPAEMDEKLSGAGGVPLRRPDDLRRIHAATRCGNHPLLRCYSGTQDLVEWAGMLHDTIANCWGAVPLFWYSQLDGRSPRGLRRAVEENLLAIAWHAGRGIPVEVTESHQWALRECGDTIEVAAAYLAAYNAKRAGVRHYVQQYMFNTPRGMGPAMDLAKMIAKAELIHPLQDGSFTVYTMVRTGLAFLSSDPHVAKGQLAFSLAGAMRLRPHIVHVVGFSEGDHAALPEEVIESCKIAEGVVRSAVDLGIPEVTEEHTINRRMVLAKEARILLEAIRGLGRSVPDPLTDAGTLVLAVQEGLLDAPHLKGVPGARGAIVTRMVDGACRAVDPRTLDPITERERLKRLGIESGDEELDRVGLP